MGSVLYNLFVTPIETIIDLIFMASYEITNSVGTAIVILSLVINFSVFPLYKKADDVQNAERLKQKKMEPWVKHIKKTFKGDERFLMQQAYYREVGYKPLYTIRGSLSLLFQIPFFMAAYNYLSSLSYLDNRSFLILKNLSEPDGLIKAGALVINLMPVLMTLLNIVSSIIYTRGLPLRDKLQTYILAVVFLVILYDSPSGLVFYWTLNQIFSLLKNVFLKLIKNPGKVLSIVFASAGTVFLVYTVLKKSSMTTFRFLAFLAIGAGCFLPLAVYFLSRYFRKNNITLIKPDPRNKKAERAVYYFSSAALTCLLGAMIPLSVIKASPAEFSTGGNPLGFILNTLGIYAGFILVWCNIFYLLGSEKFKHVLTYFSACSAVVFLIDFLFFGKNLGTLSNLLYFDTDPSFRTVSLLINLLAVIAAASAVIILLKKKCSAAKALCQTVAVFTVLSVIVNTVSTGREIKADNDRSSVTTGVSTENAVFTLSKTGKNVIVFMLDRAIGAYLPYIINEKPELVRMFDGFTYYPNTVSYGGYTNFAAPALFGGYDYTPEKLNKRKEESLASKHSEALKVMPALFGSNGYEVTVVDPPYCGNYSHIPDFSVYDGLENVTALKLDVPESDNDLLTNAVVSLQKHNFIFYSLMKAVPSVIHNVVYYLYTSYNSKNVDCGNICEFMDQYLILEKLNNITGITGENKNTLLVFQNSSTHEPLLLQEPEYTPQLNVTKKGTGNYIYNGVTMKTDGRFQLEHFQVNVASLMRIGEWLEYLKEQGVYDNTRIILVSDHGRNLGQFDNMLINDEIDAEAYNPLLLVKDFNAHGFKTDNTFMTNGDTPVLATNGLIDNPVNPFTGNPISSIEKEEHPPVITTSERCVAQKENNGNTFDTSDGAWWSVKDNIFDPANWEKIGNGEK